MFIFFRNSFQRFARTVLLIALLVLLLKHRLVSILIRFASERRQTRRFQNARPLATTEPWRSSSYQSGWLNCLCKSVFFGLRSNWTNPSLLPLSPKWLLTCQQSRAARISDRLKSQRYRSREENQYPKKAGTSIRLRTEWDPKLASKAPMF